MKYNPNKLWLPFDQVPIIRPKLWEKCSRRPRRKKHKPPKEERWKVLLSNLSIEDRNKLYNELRKEGK